MIFFNRNHSKQSASQNPASQVKPTISKIPKHIGLIMDGNKRWAVERNLKPLEGCKKGYAKLRFAPEWFFDRGVKILSILLFSTGDWERPREEVNCLMKEVKKLFGEYLPEFVQKDIRIVFSGRIEELPGDLSEICAEAIKKTELNKGGTINVCLNYGGREEIIGAIQKMMKNNVKIEQVHAGMVRKYLYRGDLDDPDLIVRLAGEQKLSGFLLWQSADSELVFLNKDWPDFEIADVEKILEEYTRKKARSG